MSDLGRLMRDLRRRNIEHCTGRLLLFPSIWTYSPGKAKVYFTHTDPAGRPYYLIDGAAVICPHVERWKDSDLVPSDRPLGVWLRQSVCRKCDSYRKGGMDRLRYPHCAWAMQERGGLRGAFQATIRSVADAVVAAKEILR